MKITPMRIVLLSILVAYGLIFGAFLLKSDGGDSGDGENVTMVDGEQIIQIKAKGGYFPRITEAKADVATTLEVTTEGTFDCSAALSIPKLSYNKSLPLSGTTKIDIPPQKAGTELQGFCAMGMYYFEIKFS